MAVPDILALVGLLLVAGALLAGLAVWLSHIARVWRNEGFRIALPGVLLTAAALGLILLATAGALRQGA